MGSELIFDVENKLRFTLRNYFLNFYLICKEKLGKENVGSNWADYLEYGTANPKIIEMQLFEIDRKLAKYLMDNYEGTLNFEKDVLDSINKAKLLLIAKGDKNLDLKELNKLLEKF